MYRPLIRKGLTLSSLTLAELYRRQLGWKFDNNKFYLFEGEPEYVMPEGAVWPADQLEKHR